MEKGFFATLFLLATLAVQRCVVARTNERYSSAAEYMKHLYEEGAHADGLPRNDDGESFSVRCLVDTGMHRRYTGTVALMSNLPCIFFG